MKTYNANASLKAANVTVNFTASQVQEYVKSSADPVYFIKKYCKIISLDRGLIPFELFEYQARFINAIHTNNRIVSMQPRQMGKSQTVAAYILYYTLFNPHKTVAILANKSSAAREIMSRYQLMYEQLPMWLQQGVVTWNKGDIELENGAKVFTAATSGSGIRGKSCVTGDTKVCVEYNSGYYYLEIEEIINNSRFIDIEDTIVKKYAIYKTTNTVNGKIYIGFHSYEPTTLIRMGYDKGSCFKDGYLGSGSLISRALTKYSPNVFCQEILEIFDIKEDAEAYEALLVNEEFVKLDSNYNVSPGGNVTILRGEDNGFFNKKHSTETLLKIKASRAASNLPTYQVKIRNINTGEIYKGYNQVLTAFNYTSPKPTNESENRRLFIAQLLNNGVIEFINESDLEENLKDKLRHRQFLNSDGHKLEISRLLAENCSKRFTGIPKSEQHRNKISEKSKVWIENNPEKHADRMSKINTNRDKIAKTAAKHTGMKRTDETRKNISDSLKGKTPKNKGKISAFHPIERKVAYFDDESDIPKDWVLGSTGGAKAGKKSYTDGAIFKMYFPGEEPNGWIPGAPKKSKS